jgi:hypothetical protein
MRPEVHHSYDEIAELPAQVRALYEKLKIEIPKGSNLASALDLCTNVNTKIDNMGSKKLMELIRAQRVLLAIRECASEAEIKEPAKRIAQNPLDPASPKPSDGKHAVFELEFLQYVRHRGLDVRLAEPDVVVQMTFGDYFIACKTINSLTNFKGQLRYGYGQVENYGKGAGCIAFNLEPHMHFEQPLRAKVAREIRDQLETLLQSLYSDKKDLLNRKLRDGRLDGVVLQMSCFAEIDESPNDLDVFTHTVYYSRTDLQEQVASMRFNKFKMAMQGPMGERSYGFS